ncbi:type II toxin-antitoxin system VapC family toxin [Aristophania vespae]|nr:type II toxin-antitoxin system VapC family toxin [Aristophania vespae]
MLDTNIVSELAQNPHGPVSHKIAEIGDDAICVSIITAAELHYGCAKKGSAKLTHQIEAILNSVKIMALDIPVDNQYGTIRTQLEASGHVISPHNLLVATQASALGAIVVTSNIEEFGKLEGLKLENWLAL